MRSYVARAGFGGSAGETDRINAAAEILTVDVEDLLNITIHATQTTDAGTVVAHVEYTLDGTNWLQAGADLTEASFPVGANTVAERTLSDANGIPKAAKKVRLRASALAGGGVYGLVVAGHQKEGFA